MSTFLDLPSEVLLLIISTFLEVQEVLVLRRTCRGISQLTRDKIVWLALIERLRNCGDIPLPPDCHALEHSSSTLESTVVSATQASDSWRLPRKIGKPILNPSNGQSILGLNIFDTWLLIVYASGLIYLWDIREGAPRRGYCDTLDLRTPGIRWTSYTASLVHGSQQVLLAISSGTSKESTKQYQTVLYSINIGPSDSMDNVFNLVHSFSDSIPRFVLAIDVANRFLVVSSSTSTLDILGWDTEQGNTFGISLDDVDTEESYNGVNALRLLGSHFLAIRTHTIELHLFDHGLRRQRRVPLLKHRLPFPLRDGGCPSQTSSPPPVRNRMGGVSILISSHTMGTVLHVTPSLLTFPERWT
ncbi:hypothetical protein B0H13DRAFT_109118 [Mycena leptocephala]|nr:hypothetical protein B0H13DRAFT_109118 [Mycena leptocephala]